MEYYLMKRKSSYYISIDKIVIKWQQAYAVFHCIRLLFVSLATVYSITISILEYFYMVIALKRVPLKYLYCFLVEQCAGYSPFSTQ